FVRRGFRATAWGLGDTGRVGMLREVLVPRGGRAAFPGAVEVARLALVGGGAQLLPRLRGLAHEVAVRARVEVALQRGDRVRALRFAPGALVAPRLERLLDVGAE